MASPANARRDPARAARPAEAVPALAVNALRGARD
jgi:hypothetical protein